MREIEEVMHLGRVVLASDHAGDELKRRIKEYLSRQNIACLDIVSSDGSNHNYVGMAKKAISRRFGSRGAILVCGMETGTAAGVFRSHNDYNILCLGQRALNVLHGFEENETPLPDVVVDAALDIVYTWLTTPYEGGRQQVDKIERLVEL